MPVDTVDTRRTVGLALMDLDAESFAFVVGQLWQLSKTAGGFRTSSASANDSELQSLARWH